MSKRLSYKSVKNFIEYESNSGCKLISKEYFGNQKKLDIMCKCGEIFNTKYSNFTHKNKRMCNKCSKIFYKQKNTHKYEDVANYISSRNCELISKEYINCDTPLKIKCSCGNTFHKSYYQFKNAGIDKCGNCLMLDGRLDFNYNFIKDYVDNSSDCKLISKEYRNNAEALEFKCKCGDFFKASFSAFRYRNKQQCNKCSRGNAGRKMMYDFQYVKEVVESTNGCSLDQLYYKGVFHPLNIICKCGNKFTTNFSNFRGGKNTCNECTSLHMSQKMSYSYEYISNYISKNTEFKLLSTEYENCNGLLNLICSCGRSCKTTFGRIKFKNKFVCNYCAPYHSKGEKLISEYFIKNKVKFTEQYKDNSLLGLGGNNLLFDFYLPDYNILIEYQGEYHDGTARNQTDEQFVIQQEHDKRKKEYAKQNNIKLLEIWYWDFDNIDQILDKELLNK